MLSQRGRKTDEKHELQTNVLLLRLRVRDRLQEEKAERRIVADATRGASPNPEGSILIFLKRFGQISSKVNLCRCVCLVAGAAIV